MSRRLWSFDQVVLAKDRATEQRRAVKVDRPVNQIRVWCIWYEMDLCVSLFNKVFGFNKNWDWGIKCCIKVFGEQWNYTPGGYNGMWWCLRDFIYQGSFSGSLFLGDKNWDWQLPEKSERTSFGDSDIFSVSSANIYKLQQNLSLQQCGATG